MRLNIHILITVSRNSFSIDFLETQRLDGYIMRRIREIAHNNRSKL